MGDVNILEYWSGRMAECHPFVDRSCMFFTVPTMSAVGCLLASIASSAALDSDFPAIKVGIMPGLVISYHLLKGEGTFVYRG